MPPPSDAYPVRITGYTAGVAQVDGLGSVPTLGGYPVTPGGTALLVRSASGSLFVVPVAAVGSGAVEYLWGGTVTGVDPGAGNLAVSGTGSNPRTFAVSGTDADGLDRNLGPLQPGDTIVLTDDPDTPPITGFARYTLTSDPVNHGGWWSFTALRSDTEGPTTPPPVGTRLRVYSHLVGGGGGASGDYVQRSGDSMTGPLLTPVLRITDEAAPDTPVWTLDDFLGVLFLGTFPASNGLAISGTTGDLFRHIAGDYFRLLDVRDLAAPVPIIATGTVNVALSGAASANVAVTFPAGRFSAPPVVMATIQNQPGGSGRLIPRAVNVTAAGCSIFVNTGNDAAATATVSVGWVAVQEGTAPTSEAPA